MPFNLIYFFLVAKSSFFLRLPWLIGNIEDPYEADGPSQVFEFYDFHILKKSLPGSGISQWTTLTLTRYLESIWKLSSEILFCSEVILKR